jgi:hypothetical protein
VDAIEQACRELKLVITNPDTPEGRNWHYPYVGT